MEGIFRLTMSFLRAALIAGLALVAVLSIAFLGYSNLSPNVVTVTQQELVTNTQSFYATQTLTSISQLTVYQTITSSTTLGNGYIGPGYANYQNCSPYGCYYVPPAYASINDLCRSTGQNNTVSCSGYLHQASDACTELAIPYINPDILETTAYLYLTLYNLPASHPGGGTWVTVTGQVYQGYPSGQYVPLCTSSYMNVVTIS